MTIDAHRTQAARGLAHQHPLLSDADLTVEHNVQARHILVDLPPGIALRPGAPEVGIPPGASAPPSTSLGGPVGGRATAAGQQLARRFAAATLACARRGNAWLLATLRATAPIRTRCRPVLAVVWQNSRKALRGLARACAGARHSLGHRGAGGFVVARGKRARMQLRRTLPQRLQGSVEFMYPSDPTANPAPSAPRARRAARNAHVATGAFALEPLPWPAGALAPIISARTVQVHHWHYAKCVRSANKLAHEHRELADKSPLDIVRWAREHARDSKLFAASSEAWNHELLWHSLTPSRLRPDRELARAMAAAFGSYSEFADAFALAGAAHVGSGWLWLVANRRKQVRIVTTANTDSPEYRGSTCLLAVDLWEHAYYFDHQTSRLKYLRGVIDSRLDWTFATARYEVAMARRAAVRPARKSRRDQDRSPAGDNIRRPRSRPQPWLRH